MQRITHELIWKCNYCGVQAKVYYKKYAGVAEVLNMIKESHDAISPDCNNRLSKLQILKDSANVDNT